jgi:hypothetical protein
MEWPLKLEITKVPHLTVLRLFTPLLPGYAIAACLFLSNSPLFLRLWNAPVGYKTKLWLLGMFVYAIGILVISMMDILSLIIMNLLRGKRQIEAWRNTYWQKTVKEYLDRANLVPNRESVTLQDIEILPRYLGQLSGKERGAFGLEAIREGHQKLLLQIEGLKASLTKAPALAADKIQSISNQIVTLSATAADIQEKSAKIEMSARDQVIEIEWMTIYMAMAQKTTVVPAGELNAVTSALQATAGSCACLMLLHWNHWPGFIIVFSIIVFLATTYLQWQLFRYGNHVNALSSSQIATMLSEIRTPSYSDDESSKDK